jgi:RNA polymerase sigma-70 factor (ECF subfamily)
VASIDDKVRLAMLVVLQRLSPIERVVFILHDIFQVPFDTIAGTVGRPAPTCRQLARRARLKIEATDCRGTPGRPWSPTPWMVTRSWWRSPTGN